jgi:cyclopropane fatty-acyl-phospholipid synthase-like methyltransferase
MIYTSGMIRDDTREETLEELQDNKLTVVCEKLNLQPTDRLLDIGCGWGTLAAFAAKNYGCTATGVTLARKQTEFGNARAAANGVADRAKIECMDFRQVPATHGKGAFTKIVSLEMAEVRAGVLGHCYQACAETFWQHVGIRRYQSFLRQVYDLLDDDGIFVFQVAGIRPSWQYEDLIW